MKKIDRHFATMIVGSAVFVTVNVIGLVKNSREKHRDAQEALARNIAHTHYTDELDALNEQLEDKIKIAEKAILDHDFSQIVQDIEEL